MDAEEEDMVGGKTPRGERLSLCPAGHPQHCSFNLGPVLRMPRVLCCLVGAGRDDKDPVLLRLQEGGAGAGGRLQ